MAVRPVSRRVGNIKNSAVSSIEPLVQASGSMRCITCGGSLRRPPRFIALGRARRQECNAQDIGPILRESRAALAALMTSWMFRDALPAAFFRMTIAPDGIKKAKSC